MTVPSCTGPEPLGTVPPVEPPPPTAAVCAVSQPPEAVRAGTGYGFQTALHVRLAAELVSVERPPELAAAARRCCTPAAHAQGGRDSAILAGVASLYSNRGAKRAREAREALGFTREGPLPDVLAAVEQRGGAHTVVLELPDGVAGAYIAKPGCPLLFVNGRQPLTRQRFTLAHEFGHHRMGHSTVIDEQAVISGYTHDPKEVSANSFAAELLMPRDAVSAWAASRLDGAVTLEDVVTLAGEYAVSAQAARYALETAKVLTDRRRCRQLDEEIESGLYLEVAARLDLPTVDDELADTLGRLPRIPTALRSSALGDLLAGTIDAERLAERLGRDPDAVRAMLSELGLEQLIGARW